MQTVLFSNKIYLLLPYHQSIKIRFFNFYLFGYQPFINLQGVLQHIDLHYPTQITHNENIRLILE